MGCASSNTSEVGAALDPAASSQPEIPTSFVFFPQKKEVTGDSEELNYRGLGFDDEQARDLIEVVRDRCTKGKLKRLNLNENLNVTVPLDDWASLAGEFKLEGLELMNCKGILGNIASLQGMAHLTKLNLDDTTVSGNVSSFAGLICLTWLGLSNTGVSGDIASVAALVELAALRLNNTTVSGDLASVAGLVKLTHLDLNMTGVSGDIANVAGLVQLITVCIGGCEGVSGDVASVAGLEKVTHLDLHDTSVTGSIVNIAKMAMLDTLYLDGTKVSAPEVCPRDSSGYLSYTDRKSYSELHAWLNNKPGDNTP